MIKYVKLCGPAESSDIEDMAKAPIQPSSTLAILLGSSIEECSSMALPTLGDNSERDVSRVDGSLLKVGLAAFP